MHHELSSAPCSQGSLPALPVCWEQLLAPLSFAPSVGNSHHGLIEAPYKLGPLAGRPYLQEKLVGK